MSERRAKRYRALAAKNSALFLRLSPKKVDSFPEIVDLSISLNKPIPLKLLKLPKLFLLKICTSANFVVPLHREPALGMSAHQRRGGADI